ncbi:hypothetical protein LOTGIDRAFT_171443 [Lottia gigantea]|uniref:C2H2-type domain-containing protein n=1 Tax=Lottia gigantea TaxID=225164 RepID=V4B061_LOTGI|nr:hypothetical protein LOTGIDRAFT_171443 [Lottia gigantea]ESP03358.1 hypothetical protein LOTGIDRAFT_171443 [Lottia gigantea]
MAQRDHSNPLPSTDDATKVIFICSVCSNKFSSLHEAQNHPGCWRENVENVNQGNGIPEKEPATEENQQILVEKLVGETNLDIPEKDAEPSLEVPETGAEIPEKIAEPSIEMQEKAAELRVEIQEKVDVPVPQSGSHFCRVCNSVFESEESLLLHCKTHQIAAPVIQQTDPEKSTESKELFLKIETDQGEFCVQLDANDIYNLSEQKVALDLDSIRKSNSASSTNNSNPNVVTSTTPLTAKLQSINYKTNYVLDLLQEKLHNKNSTPVLVDTDTKLNKPVDKVIDEIIRRNENITRKSTDSNVLHSDVSKNKPVNQIIDEIIQRNENVTRKTQSKNSYKPRLYQKPETEPSVMSLESALPSNIQPGSRLMIGGTTYEILYTSNDEANTPTVTQATEPEPNMIYIVDDSGEAIQNPQQSYTLSNMAEVAEINTVNSFDGTVPIGQITNNQPMSQSPSCFVDDIFTINSNDGNFEKRGHPSQSSSPQPCKKAKTSTKNSIEEVRTFVPAPIIEEPDDVLPEKGSMPDDLYDMIMCHLTQPKPTIFKCTMCHRSFRTDGQLKKHVDFEHKDEPPLTCKVCNTSRTYKSRAALENHLRAHEREEEIAKRLKMNEDYQGQEQTSNYICKFTSL